MMRDNQRDQSQLYPRQLAPVQRINDCVEAIQGRAGNAAGLSRWIAIPLGLWLLVPVLVLLLPALMPWPDLHGLHA